MLTLNIFDQLTTSNQQTGTIISIIRPKLRWRVHFAGTDWYAETSQPIALQVGDIVQVAGLIDATTLAIRVVHHQPSNTTRNTL